MNQETVYGWLHGKNYKELRDFLFRGKEKIKSDSMLLAAAKTVELEFVRLSKGKIEDEEFWFSLQTLHSFHPRHYELENENYKDISLALAVFHKSDLKVAIRYANLFPEEEISTEIIKLHSETEIQTIEHKRQDYIKITHNPIPIKTKATTPLFKSYEEQKLYLALRQVFDTFLIYPNVAISNVINFEVISEQLTQRERDYFYKSVIDFVVFDQYRGYEPIYFLELDSVWHDLDKVEEKDKLKDRIFSIAGAKLIRIRHKANKEIDEETYLELIEGIRRQL